MLLLQQRNGQVDQVNGGSPYKLQMNQPNDFGSNIKSMPMGEVESKSPYKGSNMQSTREDQQFAKNYAAFFGEE